MLRTKMFGDGKTEERVECTKCGTDGLALPNGISVFYKTARCSNCGTTFGKWRDILDEAFDVVGRKAMRD